MSERERMGEDLRATSEAITSDVKRLGEMEKAKREMTPDDPRLVEMSAKAERLAGQVHRETKAERELAERLSREG